MKHLITFQSLLREWFCLNLLRRVLFSTGVGGKNRKGSDRDAPYMLHMFKPTTRTFTSRDERRAFRARQALWIRYEDTLGNVRESVVEIYHPGKRNVIFTWCRVVEEPRAFARRRIRSWRLLNKRYTVDQVTTQYWEEEGHFEGSKRLPWTSWLREQLEKDADFQRHMKLAA